ncbi:MAG: hypothetical protein KF901_35025 [Myxococcales bacterium]|nr:hypothetical protein [Myxococcales bacterium]
MSFGRNPHVSKAEAAEQKALDARDDDSRKRAYLEAAHLWERAAEREKPGKKRDEYLQNAERNRALEAGAEEAEDTPAPNVIPFPRRV